MLHRHPPQTPLLDCFRAVDREDYVGTKTSSSGTLRGHVPIERISDEKRAKTSIMDLSTSVLHERREL